MVKNQEFLESGHLVQIFYSVSVVKDLFNILKQKFC
jgi:hypothetical protein